MPAPAIPQPNSDDAIDEAMINQALEVSNGNTDWVTAENLDLSFRRVAKIENLVCFDMLKSLSLSNNRIREISNLAHLGHSLTSLDLSFNSITVLGDEITMLVNLRELSLHSNGIAELTKLESLKNLTVLNVGHNKIASLESFLPLRKSPNLRALISLGNPVSSKFADDYEAFLLAYIGQLGWLDYRVVDSEKVAACKEQFQNEIEALASSESIKKAEAAQAERDKLSQASLRSIYMFEAATLFSVLIKDDELLASIAQIEGLSKVEDNLEKDLNAAVEELHADLDSRCKEIEKDKNEFTERLDNVYSRAQEQSVALIKGLKRARKQLFSKELMCSLPPRISVVGDTSRLDLGQTEKTVRAFKDQVDTVREELESIESSAETSALQLIDRFEDNYSAMMNALTDILAEFFQKGMTLANRFYESLRELAVAAVTLHIEEQGDFPADSTTSGQAGQSDAPPMDPFTVLLSSIDAMMEVVNGVHERHESVILGCDDRVRKSIKDKLATTVLGLKEREFERSRNVVTGIISSSADLLSTVDAALDAVKAKLERY